MKKAVTLLNSLLSKAKRRSRVEKEDPESDEKPFPNFRSEDERVKIARTTCSRCVLVCDINIWRQCAVEKLFGIENARARKAVPADDEAIGNVRSLLGFYGVEPKYGSLSDWSIVVHKRLRCSLDHLWSFFAESDSRFDAHCPGLMWIAESTGQWRNPVLHEERDFFLLRLSLAILCSLAGFALPMSLVGGTANVEVWALMLKAPKQVVSLVMEEELNSMVFDETIWIAFFDLPVTMNERAERMEAILQAVDDIIDIASYVTLTAGNEADIQSSVKEVIIETATVVTSTAAESTATVGIETAAMALGQAAAGVAISVLVDIALTAGSVTRAKLQRDKGLITNSQFKSTVRRRLCDSSCQFIGGTTGTIVGQVLIPVPVVGAIVGGFFGSLIGVGVSKGIIKTSEIISKAQANRMKALTEK